MKPDEEMMAELRALGRDPIFCRRCGQTLTDPKSKKLGIGPICLGKENEEKENEGEETCDETTP